MVLILVLWLFIFLFVIALDFSASVREDATAAQRFGAEVDGYYLALAGLSEGLHQLLNRPVQPGQAAAAQTPELAEGIWSEGQLGQGLYRVRIVDEGGKISLNRAEEETLRRVFRNLGVEGERSAVLTDSILDWRDQDELHRANGAESDYYRAQPFPYTAKNGPFETVEDLLWVRGMSPDLFYGREENGGNKVALRDIFTVDSQIARVNLRTATAPVIHALLGIPLSEAERFVEERRKLSDKSFADLLRLVSPRASEVAQRYFVFTPPSIITIEAAGYYEGSNMERKVKAVVRLVGGNRGVEILRWLDEDFGAWAGKS